MVAFIVLIFKYYYPAQDKVSINVQVITNNELFNNLCWQKKLFSLQEEQTLEKQDLMRKKAIYSLALAEMEKPLLKLEEEAEKIKTCHQEHADVSIYH